MAVAQTYHGNGADEMLFSVWLLWCRRCWRFVIIILVAASYHPYRCCGGVGAGGDANNLPPSEA